MKRVLILLFLLVACAKDTAYTVEDRWWEWEREACRDYTECLPTIKPGGGITIHCSTKTRVLCRATATGKVLPPVQPALSCTGSYYRDDVGYFATIKADGEKNGRVSFSENLWEMMVTGNKVCLRVIMGHASKCRE